MDISGLLIIPLSAILTAASIIGAALLSRPRPRLIYPFAASFVLGFLFLGPWRWPANNEWGLLAAELGLIAFWVTFGVAIGALSSVIAIKLSRVMQGFARPRA